MNKDHLEIEVKIQVPDARAFAEKLEAMGLRCIQRISKERNLRYDDAEGTLKKNHQVLRLRKTEGGDVRLTWKASHESSNGIAIRTEHEVVVNDYDTMKEILEGLGYSVFFIYEKYRGIYEFRDTHIFVDRTPIGDFVEIEGENEDVIRSAAEALGLDWSLHTDKGYLKLFKDWNRDTGSPDRNMVFDEQFPFDGEDE